MGWWRADGWSGLISWHGLEWLVRGGMGSGWVIECELISEVVLCNVVCMVV